jgi:uncharacterized protein (TIGR03083 family)
MESSSRESVLQSFRSAVDWFVGLTAAVPATAWEAHGLGEWTIRDLVGHTGRALSTVAEYLTDSTAAPDLTAPVDYYRGIALSGPGSAELNAAVAERGRQAGAQLGDDPAAAVGALAANVTRLVVAADPEALATSRGGSIRLIDYLPTRTFEFVVHGLDLVSALTSCGVANLPAPPPAAVADTAHLLIEVVGARGGSQLSDLISVLTGRASLAPGYSAL